MPALLEANSIYKTYRLGRVDVPVLRGASLSAEENECVAVLGAPGSGKSTLLHILGGLDRCDSPPNWRNSADSSVPAATANGKPISSPTNDGVSFGGEALASFSPAMLDRYRSQSVGFVFQFYHLLPELTVLQNTIIASMIDLGRVAYMKNRRELRTRATDLLERFGLGDRLRHRPVELSGGERQRVAIARALMNSPKVLLADEPTGNLDQETGAAILNVLMELRKDNGLTMVIVTHDPVTAQRADRVVRLKDGKVEGGEGPGIGE